jgi:hypothetical protein
MGQKFVNGLQNIVDRTKNGVLIISIHSFENKVHLQKVIQDIVTKYRKKFSGINLHYEVKPQEIQFKLNKNNTKISSITILNHGQRIYLEFHASFYKIRKISSHLLHELESKLQNHIKCTIESEIGEIEKRSKGFWNYTMNESSLKSLNIKKEIWNILWLEFGVNDEMSEEEINKVVETANKIKPKVINKKIEF